VRFLNRVTWSPRLFVIGLVAFALLAMAPQMRSVDEDEEDQVPPDISIVASRIDSSLRSRSTAQRQPYEPKTVTTAPALAPRGVRAREANFSWYGGRSMLKSFCFASLLSS
jgi:hypothetical protein